MRKVGVSKSSTPVQGTDSGGEMMRRTGSGGGGGYTAASLNIGWRLTEHSTTAGGITVLEP